VDDVHNCPTTCYNDLCPLLSPVDNWSFAVSAFVDKGGRSFIHSSSTPVLSTYPQMCVDKERLFSLFGDPFLDFFQITG
jgi:hypothetical protein